MRGCGNARVARQRATGNETCWVFDSAGVSVVCQISWRLVGSRSTSTRITTFSTARTASPTMPRWSRIFFAILLNCRWAPLDRHTRQEAQLSPRDRVMKLKRYSMALKCNKHVHSTMTRSSRFHCPIGVINKSTTDELWISPLYRRLAVAKFSKSTM